MTRKRGFTLMELLIVVMIAGLLLSVVLPFSMETYGRYRGLMIAERLMLFLAERRVEAFLYGRDIRIEVRDEKLLSTDGKAFEHPDCKITLPRPIEFYARGTSSGGTVEITCRNHDLLIEVEPFTGKITLKR